MDRGYITNSELKQIYDLADEAKKLINGLIGYLRKTGIKTSNTVSEDRADYNSATSVDIFRPDIGEIDGNPIG